MTHNLEFKYSDPQDPFAIIPTPWGEMEAWRASTIATGTMGALAQVHQIVRNDAAELEQKTVELDAKKHAVLSTINRLVKFMSRVDSLTARVEQLEAKRRSDEEQQQQFEEEPIELPPDLDRLQDLPPSKIGADANAAETHHPSGDLHSVEAKEEPSELPEPPLEEGDDNVGDLPEELAEPPGPVPEPKGSVYPQPISVSLNEG
jgi:hypothetical protein